MRHSPARLSQTIGILRTLGTLGTLGILTGLLSAGCRQDPATPAAGPAKEAAAGAPMTLTITNARVWTGDPAQPWADRKSVV